MILAALLAMGITWVCVLVSVRVVLFFASPGPTTNAMGMIVTVKFYVFAPRFNVFRLD